MSSSKSHLSQVIILIPQEPYDAKTLSELIGLLRGTPSKPIDAPTRQKQRDYNDLRRQIASEIEQAPIRGKQRERARQDRLTVSVDTSEQLPLFSAEKRQN